MENCGKEHFSAEELRLLQNVLNTDRKTIDYIEGVVSGLDMTERRASAGVLQMKIRRLLDRELSDEIEARRAQLQATQAAEEAQAAATQAGVSDGLNRLEEGLRKGPLGIEPAAEAIGGDPPAAELAGQALPEAQG